jgi:cbb3-type cytochrome oxidase subunit 3
MDLNTLRIVVTVLSFLCFLLIFLWAYGRKNAAKFQRLGRDCLDLPPSQARKKNHDETFDGVLP